MKSVNPEYYHIKRKCKIYSNHRISLNWPAVRSEMAAATLNLIFEQPQLPIELVEQVTKEYGEQATHSNRKMERAWGSLRRNRHLDIVVRMRRLLAVYINLVHSWQRLVARAQLLIGHGEYLEPPNLPFEITNAENPHVDQLRALDTIIFELNGIMRQILLHATTRIAEIQ